MNWRTFVQPPRARCPNSCLKARQREDRISASVSHGFENGRFRAVSTSAVGRVRAHTGCTDFSEAALQFFDAVLSLQGYSCRMQTTQRYNALMFTAPVLGPMLTAVVLLAGQTLALPYVDGVHPGILVLSACLNFFLAAPLCWLLRAFGCRWWPPFVVAGASVVAFPAWFLSQPLFPTEQGEPAFFVFPFVLVVGLGAFTGIAFAKGSAGAG